MQMSCSNPNRTLSLIAQFWESTVQLEEQLGEAVDNQVEVENVVDSINFPPLCPLRRPRQTVQQPYPTILVLRVLLALLPL